MYTYVDFNNRPDPEIRIEDCAIRAVAFASGKDYFDVLKLFGKEDEYDAVKKLNDPQMFGSTTVKEYRTAIDKMIPRPKKINPVVNGKILTLDGWAQISRKYPQCTFVFCVCSKSKAISHITACRDGQIFDCWEEQFFRQLEFRVMDAAMFQPA